MSSHIFFILYYHDLNFYTPHHSCLVLIRGDCASCTISVGGSRVKACVGKVPPEPRLKSLKEKGLPISG